MAFIKIDGFNGKIFVPENRPDFKKKHPCSDCFSCRFCSDERCSLCLKKKCCKKNNPDKSE